MKELTLPPELSCEIREIYDSMVAAYDEVAGAVTLTCDGCPDNCCDSYFLHYTYCEWAYLWQGIRGLGDEQLDRILRRARDYVAQSRVLISRGERPTIMCPLNEAGRCTLYAHRLMICRTRSKRSFLSSESPSRSPVAARICLRNSLMSVFGVGSATSSMMRPGL